MEGFARGGKPIVTMRQTGGLMALGQGNEMTSSRRNNRVAKGPVLTREFLEFCATDSGLPASRGRAILDTFLRTGEAEFDPADKVYRWTACGP